MIKRVYKNLLFFTNCVIACVRTGSVTAGYPVLTTLTTYFPGSQYWTEISREWDNFNKITSEAKKDTPKSKNNPNYNMFELSTLFSLFAIIIFFLKKQSWLSKGTICQSSHTFRKCSCSYFCTFNRTSFWMNCKKNEYLKTTIWCFQKSFPTLKLCCTQTIASTKEQHKD